VESYKIENLKFRYPASDKLALDNITCTINEGEFVCVCGKSGCGKSTLLRQLKPCLTPYGEKSGNIFFMGRDIGEMDFREQSGKIGFVAQNPENQIVTDKVWHELAFGLESLGQKQNEIRIRVAEIASFFGIQTWFHKKVTELSGGQKQLLNLAGIMAMQPSVLILDEPTSQLDPIAAQDFLDTVSKINRELGTTIILTEHRLEEAFALSDRVIVLDEGKKIADGTPAQIGGILKVTKHDMFAAMPTAMRVYASVDADSQCPVTVREGRVWLSGLAKEREYHMDFASRQKSTKQTGEPVISLKDVWFRYEKNLPDVVRGVSADIDKGELYAIVGGNGTGKTTALSLISGINTPYRGEILINGREIASLKDIYNGCIGVLPQNPQAVFVKKTVLLDLYEILKDKKFLKEEKKALVSEVVKLCELESLADRHPYDLSGGEQQRAALAKILLLKPKILLLDEPTKGLDAHFKIRLANILKSLQKSGVTIVMVSHDIEFCAKYADRCAMFFDGRIVGEDDSRAFFSGKNFYTTAANRMARHILPGAVLAEDIISAFGGQAIETETGESKPLTINFGENTLKKDIGIKPESKNLPKSGIALGILFFSLFLLTPALFYGKFEDFRTNIVQFCAIVFLALGFSYVIPQKTLDTEISGIQAPKTKRKLSKRTLAAAVMIFLAIPLTIYIGVYFLGDRKYYFISLLVILETMLPFMLVFEKRKPQARELVIISVLCAIGVAGRAAFYMLPQFKPIIAVVIISGVCFGGETGFLVGAMTGFVSNFFFGQGPWTPWQMFSFGIIGFLAGILFRKGFLRKTRGALCIYGGLATLIIYGGIMNPASVILGQEKLNSAMILSSYAMGLPFDMVHAAATVFFLWFAAAPMIEKLDRVKVKYGIIDG